MLKYLLSGLLVRVILLIFIFECIYISCNNDHPEDEGVG